MKPSNKTLKRVKDEYYKDRDVKRVAKKFNLTENTLQHYLNVGLDTKKYIILSDVHVPFHNEVLVNKVIELCHRKKFDGLIFNGDFLDLYSIASFNDNSVARLQGVTLGREYEQGREVLDRFDALDIEEKVFLFGNHEERFDRFIQKGDNAKLIGALGRPEDELELVDRGYKVIRDYPDGFYKLGHSLEVIHGTYTNMHPSKKHLQEFKTSVIFGHTHRMDSYFDGQFGAWNIGGLYDKHSEGFKYVNRAVRRKWVNGFAIVNIDELGNHYVEMINCYNNNFFAEGMYL